MPAKTKALLILIALFVTCISLTILGLTANNIAWVDHRFENDENFVDVSFYLWNNTQQRGWDRHATIEYMPGNLSISDSQAVLAGGVIGALCGAAVLVMSVWERERKMYLNISGRRRRQPSYTGSSQIVALNSLIVLVFVVVTSYSWTLYKESVGAFFDPYNVDLDNMVLLTGTTHYRSHQPYLLETWNCALSKVVPANATSPSKNELHSLCKQAMAARVVAVPLLLLAALGLGIHFWTWRRQNIATRGVRDGIQVQGHDQHWQDAQGGLVEAGSTDVTELPVADAKVTELAGGKPAQELPGSGDLQELPGSDGWKELMSEDVQEREKREA